MENTFSSDLFLLKLLDKLVLLYFYYYEKINFVLTVIIFIFIKNIRAYNILML